jgi:hypothetical protein
VSGADAVEPDEPAPKRKLRPNGGANSKADPNDPYNIAERAADEESRRGGTRESIAAAAARALTGGRPPGYGEQIIVQLVTTSALMRRASTDATAQIEDDFADSGSQADDVREAIRQARDVLDRLAQRGASNDRFDANAPDPRPTNGRVGGPHAHGPRRHGDAAPPGDDDLARGSGQFSAIANALVDAADARDASTPTRTGRANNGHGATTNPPDAGPGNSAGRANNAHAANSPHGPTTNPNHTDVGNDVGYGGASNAHPASNAHRAGPGNDAGGATTGRGTNSEYATNNGHGTNGAVPQGSTKRTAPGRSAPLALMLRADAPWLRAAAAVSVVDVPTLSELATKVRETLMSRGASFLGDLAAEMSVEPTAIEDGLWELVGAGLATADGFASLRVLVDRKRGEVKSLFDKARDARDAAPPPVRTWAEAIKKARTRDHRRPGHALRSLPTAAGRWSLLPPAQVSAIDAEATARQLLQRYGVVFRDLVLRESSLPPWRDVLIALRRLEARGEIRGGRFVSGFVGEQFALPEALDELRAVRNPAPSPCVARVPATDPLNLIGILSAGPRVPAVVGNAVLFVDGQPVASIEAGQLVLRAPLPLGARVDEDLTYIPPPRPPERAPQAALPL